MNTHWGPFYFCVRFFIVLALPGCSVDLFRENPPEKYHGMRPECSGLKISQPELDPVTFRALIQCFDANGSIPEIHRLVSEASDSTLQKTVDLLNSAFLSNARDRADSREITKKLDERGEWGTSLKGFRSIFQKPERIRALARLLSVGGRDPVIVNTVSKFDPKSTHAGAEFLLRLSKSPAFAELIRKIHADPLREEERDRLIRLLLDFLKRSTPYSSARGMIEDLASGKSSSVWPFLFGEGEEILNSTSRFTLFLRDLTGPNGLRRISQFHRGFHHSISCWEGGKTFKEPWKNLSSELRTHAAAGPESQLSFVVRFAMMTALGIQELCPLPKEFAEHYSSVLQFTVGRTGGEYIGLLNRILTGGFGVSAGYFVGEWGESLADVLTVFEPKSWFGDLVLLFGELDEGDRENFSKWTLALLKDQAEWTKQAKSWTESDLNRFFRDLGMILGSEPSEISEVLSSMIILFESSRVHPWFEGWKRISLKADSTEMISLTDLPEFYPASLALGQMAEDGRLAEVLKDTLEILAGGRREVTSSLVHEVEIRIQKPPRHFYIGSDLKPLETWPKLDESLKACVRLDLHLPIEDQWENYRDCLVGGGVESSAWGGLKIAREWKIEDPKTKGEFKNFFDSFISSWVQLPLSLSEKQGLIESMLKISSFDFRSVLAEFRFRFSLFGGRPSEIFNLLNDFQTELKIDNETWNSFFKGIGASIEDSRFILITSALKNWIKTSTEHSKVRVDAKIGPPALPSLEETADWVRNLECRTGDLNPRLQEVAREYHEAVLGWERPEGHLPWAWTEKMLLPRVRSLSESFSSPSLRSNLYTWAERLSAENAARWFHDRSSDPKLVAVLDPESKQLRVRWMTSLDRLESILVNANFTYLLKGNYGLRFIGRFAEAWGDEPRSQWPKEIQERYPVPKSPPKLKDVYAEVEAFLNAFQKFGGIPSAPSCVVKESTASKSALVDPWATAPDALIPYAVKVKAFNLKQTLSVIRENLPGSGAPGAEGMRFLRDLFWAVYSSAPDSERNPARLETNPLRFFLRIGDLGALRSISRGLQSLVYNSERVALRDAFSGLSQMVSDPALEGVLARIFKNPDALDGIVVKGMRLESFHFGTLVTRVMNGLGFDKNISGLAPLLRFLDRVLGPRDAPFPYAVFAEVLAVGGEGESEKLFSLEDPDVETQVTLKELGGFFETRIAKAIEALPVREAIGALERNPEIRKKIQAEVKRWTVKSDRQISGDLFTELFFSNEHPEVRRMAALWLSQNAGRFTATLASRPDESFLMVDGLLQSSQSPSFQDFLDSLLRQLRD